MIRAVLYHFCLYSAYAFEQKYKDSIKINKKPRQSIERYANRNWLKEVVGQYSYVSYFSEEPGLFQAHSLCVWGWGLSVFVQSFSSFPRSHLRLGYRCLTQSPFARCKD